MIRNSVEWAITEDKLRRQINSKICSQPNKHDVCRMLDNIGTKVTLLSKAEVLARRGQTGKATELLSQINGDINMVEEFILVAALIG